MEIENIVDIENGNERKSDRRFHQHSAFNEKWVFPLDAYDGLHFHCDGKRMYVGKPTEKGN